MKRMGSHLLLLLAALVWGAAFVAQRSGTDSVPPLTFLACRSGLTVLALLPLALPRLKKADRKALKRTALAGSVCGVCLCAASALQQAGIADTTAGKAGFLTALYIIFVPILGLLLGKGVRANVWVSVALAAVGLYFLCAMGESGGFGRGELLELACALVFAIHILTIDRLGGDLDGITLSWFQFVACFLCALILAVFTETTTPSAVLSAWLPIAYAGVFSGAVGYTLQIIGQKNVEPAVASLLMSLESVFSVLTGWLLLHEHLSGWELLGCALVFAAVILSQLPQRAKATR